jgi:hypothetical protein
MVSYVLEHHRLEKHTVALEEELALELDERLHGA